MRLEWVSDNPMAKIKTPRTPRRSPRPLPQGELDAMMNLPNEFKREREWTILGAYAGLRAGEVSELPGNRLLMGTHGMVLRVHGKNNVIADIPAHPKVIEILEQYSGALPIWDMWAQSLNRSWQRAGRSVGIEGRVFHQLRHSYATRLYQVTGGSLLTVASACRHASVATTQRYAAVADDAPYLAVAGL
jgi:integrase